VHRHFFRHRLQIHDIATSIFPRSTHTRTPCIGRTSLYPPLHLFFCQSFCSSIIQPIYFRKFLSLYSLSLPLFLPFSLFHLPVSEFSCSSAILKRRFLGIFARHEMQKIVTSRATLFLPRVPLCYFNGKRRTDG